MISHSEQLFLQALNIHNLTMVVWSYSLYGNNKEVYYKPMLDNILTANAVGAKILISTTELFEAEVKEYFATYLDDITIKVYPSTHFDGSEMILRFLAVETISADFYFIKDADSIVTDREISIMNDWMMLSTEPFLIIRDNSIHVAPMLAGMFGFKRNEREAFVKHCQRYFTTSPRAYRYGMDQRWLADEIYPLIRNKAQVYSSYFYFTEEKLVIINRSQDPARFIGAQADGNVNPKSMQTYFERFYGDQMLSLPYLMYLPRWLSHLIYGRVRPSLYLAKVLTLFKR